VRASRFLIPALVALVALVGAGGAAAHDVVVITLSTINTPDPGDPLRKVYEVSARYADEGAPIEGGALELTAEREGLGGRVGPLQFTPISPPGQFEVEVRYPTYGAWNVRVKVTKGGSGEATFRQEILPVSGGGGAEPVVRIVLGYSTRDVTNIVVRVVHLGTGAVWLILSAVVLAFAMIRDPERPRRLASVSGVYAWAGGALLAASILSGVYNSLYSTPLVYPGILKTGVLLDLPFGGDYLVTFLVKMGLVAAGTLGTVYVAYVLRRWFRVPLPLPAGGAIDEREGWSPEKRLAVAAGIVVAAGVLIMLDVVVLNYLHRLTHLGAFARSRGG